MNRRGFFARFAGVVALVTLAPEIIGTTSNPAPISAAQLKEVEDWIFNELSRRFQEEVERQMRGPVGFIEGGMSPILQSRGN